MTVSADQLLALDQVTPAAVRRAALLVCSRATDATEAQHLLDVLGLAT